MASFEFLAIIFTGLGLTASIVYYANILRNANENQRIQQETRNAQFFMQFVKEIHSPDFLSFWVQMLRWEWEDFEDFERKYGSVDNPEDFAKRYSFWSIMNDLGWLVEKGMVGIDDANAIVGQSLFWTWTKFESIIHEHRKIYNMPDAFMYWENLYHKAEEYRKQKGILMEVPEYFDDYLSTLSNR